MKEMKKLEELEKRLDAITKNYKEGKLNEEEYKTERDKFTKAELNLIEAYMRSKKFSDKDYTGCGKYVTDYLVIEDIWARLRDDSVKVALTEYEVNEFVLADRSTALMRELIYILNSGYTIKGSIVYARYEIVEGFGDMAIVEDTGLLIVKE